MIKNHLKTVAVIIPLVVLARYTLFRDGVEFALFYTEMKSYVVPLGIVYALIAICGQIYFASRPNQLLRTKFTEGFFWLSSVTLILAFAAVFIHVKLAETAHQ